MKGKRISKKQKRVKAINRKTALRVSRHLVMGDQHDADREAAAKIRAFPVVPQLVQCPFPHERAVGFAGHYIDGEFHIQGSDEFEAMNVAYKADAWYWRHDPRGNRKARKEVSGIVETNVAISSGLAHVLAVMAKEEKFDDVRRLTLCAGREGMAKLEQRSGYLAAYMALHPDSEGTLSFHFGLWPVDRNERKLIGRSATGKKGRRGLRTLGDAFMSVLRHHFAIGLPANLVWRPLDNLKKRDPDDWAAGLAMDRVLREEISKLSNGPDLLRRADEYQKEAAGNWLERYEAGAAGVAKLQVERDAALKATKQRKKAADRLARIKSKKHERELQDILEQAAESQKKSAQVSVAMACQHEQLENARLILGAVDGEGIADAAARVVAVADALGVKMNSSVAESERLKAEREQLNAERNQFKTDADQKTGLLAQIRAIFDINADAEIVSVVKRIVGEAKQVPELKSRIGQMKETISLSKQSLETEQEKVRRLEEEIEPLRALGKLVKKFLLLLMESPLALKLDAKLKEIAQELGKIVGFSFAPKKKQDGPQID